MASVKLEIQKQFHGEDKELWEHWLKCTFNWLLPTACLTGLLCSELLCSNSSLIFAVHLCLDTLNYREINLSFFPLDWILGSHTSWTLVAAKSLTSSFADSFTWIMWMKSHFFRLLFCIHSTFKFIRCLLKPGKLYILKVRCLSHTLWNRGEGRTELSQLQIQDQFPFRALMHSKIILGRESWCCFNTAVEYLGLWACVWERNSLPIQEGGPQESQGRTFYKHLW